VGFLVSFDSLIFNFFSYNFWHIFHYFPLTKPDAKLLKLTVAAQRLRIALLINWNEQHFPTFPPEAKQMQWLKHVSCFQNKIWWTRVTVKCNTPVSDSQKHYIRLVWSSGNIPFLNSCHSGPRDGKSRSDASSNIVIPTLNMSAAFVKCPVISSGARYFGSPSTASSKSSYNINTILVGFSTRV
jgi:hypothetical protein